MLATLDAAAVRRWAAACARGLDAERELIDRINVFPVPDGDTGTNLSHTMRAALDALLRVPRDVEVGAAMSALARGALAGARGNSGVILSQVLRGLAEALRGSATAGPEQVRAALTRADELATAAVTRPVDGTALTVLRAAARAARDSSADQLSEVLAEVAAAAGRALAETPRQLEVLARAGVVDAGGRGLVVVLEALASVVSGRVVSGVADVAPMPRLAEALTAPREAGSGEFDYEVMYLLDRTDEDRVTALRARLTGIGDCVSVVGDGADLWAVHVHCADVGAAIEAGVEAGRPHRITVIRFAEQVATVTERFPRKRAVVVLALGDGMAGLFRGEGAAVVPVGQHRAVSEADVLAAISGTRAAQVIVLPGTQAFAPIVELAAGQARQAGQEVIVVPTSSPVQVLAALAVHDERRRGDADAVAMAEAAAATRRGELLIAKSEALTWVGRCQPGDVLALADGEVVLIEPGADGALSVAAGRLVELMLSSGGELVTVLCGQNAPADIEEDLTRRLRESRPEVELGWYPGGQTEPVLLIGVE